MTDTTQLEKELRDAIQEIADLKARLTESKRQYMDIFEGAGDSIFIVELETDKIIDCNANAARRLGYTKSELVGMSHSDIEVIDPNTMMDNLFESAHSGTRIYECEYIHKAGHRIPVEVSSRMMHIDNRQTVMSFVRNISLRKDAQKREMDIRIERERMELLMQFIQNAGHEFRTPLSIIKTSIYLMTKSDDETLRQSHASKISDQVDRISDFVDTMLLVTKLETKKIRMSDTIDIASTLTAICNDMQSKFGDAPALHTKFQNNMPTIKGNTEYIAEAFRQIIINSYQFTPPDKSINIIATLEGESIRIIVEDEGRGIATDVLPNIFQLFWREDKSHSTAGFGLGLPIAGKIIEQHNGQIDVVSEAGQGTQFIIHIPTAPV